MISLGFVFLAAGPWSAAMTIVGLWCMASTPGTVVSARFPSFPAGIAAVACGQLVFMVCVCDRIYPRASRTIVAVCEGLAGGTLVLALAGVALAMVFR